MGKIILKEWILYIYIYRERERERERERARASERTQANSQYYTPETNTAL